MIDWHPEYTKSVWYTVMAGIGGALGFMYRESNAGHGVKIVKVLLAMAVASFLGFHLVTILRELPFGLSEGTIGAINGVAAFMGVDVTFRLFDTLVLKRLGISYEQRIAKDLVDAGWNPPAIIRAMDIIPEVPVVSGNEQTISTVESRLVQPEQSVAIVSQSHG